MVKYYGIQGKKRVEFAEFEDFPSFPNIACLIMYVYARGTKRLPAYSQISRYPKLF